jgi:hypothetical protein
MSNTLLKLLPVYNKAMLRAEAVATNKYRYMPVLLLSALIILAARISTSITYTHLIIGAVATTLAVMIPAYFSRHIWYDDVIHFPFRHGRGWYRNEILYIFLTATIAYLVLPYYLKSTGAYHNWMILPGVSGTIRLFIGAFGLGVWDELFFVTTILTCLRLFLPFWRANIVQAVLWVTFLYVLGFRGWGPLALFWFCLSQGYIFRQTKSLLYILTIHLTLDFILTLALLHAHSSSWVPIFITR